jgi:hypothetical protein
MNAHKFYYCAAIPPLIFLAGWLFLYFFQSGIAVEPHLAKRGLRWDEKRELIERFAETRKIVIIAGSGSYVGISARQIEDALGVPTLNVALMASFGIRYYVDTLKPLLRPGDIVVMPLEYWFFESLNGGNDFQMDIPLFIARHDPDYFSHLSLYEKAQWGLTARWRHILAGVKVKLGLNAGPNVSIPDKGIAWRGDVPLLFKHKPKLFKKITSRELVFGPDSIQLKRIADFATWARRNQIQLIAAYPAYVDHPVLNKASTEFLSAITRYWRGLGVPIIGTAEAAFYPPRYIFDTVYHLTDRGRTLHTSKFLSHLCALADADGLQIKEVAAVCRRPPLSPGMPEKPDNAG